jgi:glycosyltransferase involved in cell wall biosynthesis
MRVLVVGPRGISGHEGGIEKFTDEFVRRAVGVCRLSVLCLTVPPEDRIPAGLELVQVPKSSLLTTDKGMYLIWALWIYATRPIDRVLVLGTNFGGLVPLMKLMFWRRARIYLRSGSIDHVLTKWSPPVRLLLRLSEWLTRFADGVIAVSPSIQSHLTSIGIPSVLVRNGLERRPPPAAARTPGTVIAVGRITMQKNYGVLIEASARLGKSGPAVTIVGGADLSGESDRLTDLLKANPEARVSFVGALPRSEVLTLLDRHALYVMCSIHEGMSNSVMEAIQQRIPIILSDIEANRDLALPDHFYFDPNDPVALAEKISTALADPGRFVVSTEIFEDWDHVIARILNVAEITDMPSLEVVHA